MEDWLLARARVGEKFQYKVTSQDKEPPARPSSAASVDRRVCRHRRRAASECKSSAPYTPHLSDKLLPQTQKAEPHCLGLADVVLVLTGPGDRGEGRQWSSVRTVGCLVITLALRGRGVRGGWATGYSAQRIVISLESRMQNMCWVPFKKNKDKFDKHIISWHIRLYLLILDMILSPDWSTLQTHIRLYFRVIVQASYM